MPKGLKNVPGDPVEQKNSITWLGYFIQCNKNSPIGKRQPKGRKKYGNRRRHCEGLRQRRGKPVGSGAEQTARMGSRVAEQAVEMTTNPWTDGVLPARLIELVLVGLNASRTNLNPRGHAPPHPGRYRGGCDPSRDLVRSQVCIGHVHSFRQL